ncbi:MAG: hypothetical protein WB870_06935 [Gallionellaceae bacterium]
MAALTKASVRPLKTGYVGFSRSIVGEVADRVPCSHLGTQIFIGKINAPMCGTAQNYVVQVFNIDSMEPCSEESSGNAKLRRKE